MKYKKNLIMKNHFDLEKKIRELMNFGLMMIIDVKHNFDSLTKIKKQIIAESLLLRACAYWESFIEREMILLIYLDDTKFKTELEIPKKRRLDLDLIKVILYSDRYRDFYDIDRSKGIFGKYIRSEYNLFNNLDTQQKDDLYFIYTMRNYLAHYSNYSKKKLILLYRKRFKNKKFFEPGALLIKSKGKYFEEFLHCFILFSCTMKSNIKNI